MKPEGTWGIEIEIGVGRDFSHLSSWKEDIDGSIGTEKLGVRAIELVSPVFQDHKSLIVDVLKYNGKFLEANDSMGIHIHFKPKNFHYNLLTNKEFVTYVQDVIAKAFPEMWSIRRSSNYCRAFNGYDFVDDQIQRQINPTRHTDVRYKAINFCHNQHGTIEFRIFASTTSVKKIRLYILKLHNTITKFLKHQKLADIAVTAQEEEETNIQEISLSEGIKENPMESVIYV